MADMSTIDSSSNVIDPVSQNPNPNNNNNGSPLDQSHNSPIDVPGIGSPSLSQMSQSSQHSMPQPQQQQQINQNVNVAGFQQQQQLYQQQLQLQQQQQQNNLIGINRFASVTRMNQQQQQQQQQQEQQLLRQKQAALYGQMNFGGSILNQQLLQQPSHLQSAGAAAQFNLQTQLLGSPRQRASILQESQFQRSNSFGQSAQMQALQMMGFGSQMRGNAPISYGQQQVNQAPLALSRQLTQQTSLSSPQGQNSSRASSLGYMNPQLTGLAQNGQSSLMQNPLVRQQWLKQMPTIAGSRSQSSRLQQHQREMMIQQQIDQSSHLQQNIPLTSQQLSQLVQQQQLTGHPQQRQQSQQMTRPLQQQLSPRLQGQGPSGQKSISLTGSQPDATASGITTPGGSSSQGNEATNQLLGKRKIHDLVSQVDGRGKLDPEVEDLLLEIADDFIDSVTTFACNLAKHRKSSTIESKDVLLHLEKNWRLTIPGYSSEERKGNQDNPSSDLHKKRLNLIRALMESSQSESHANNSKDTARQLNNSLPGSTHIMRPSPSQERLLAQSAIPQMTRF